MNKLERWLPFKFRRKNRDDKNTSAEVKIERATDSTRRATHDALALTPLRHLMQSMFSDPFLRDPFTTMGQLDRWFGDFSPSHFVPNVEVADEEGALRVTAELPGMSKSDIRLSIDANALVISGEKKNENESRENGVYRTERFYGHFQRTIPLPDDVAHDKADASFADGVLTVMLPKVTNAVDKSRTISIK